MTTPVGPTGAPQGPKRDDNPMEATSNKVKGLVKESGIGHAALKGDHKITKGIPDGTKKTDEKILDADFKLRSRL